MELRTIDKGNVVDVIKLEVRGDQRRFVATNAISLAQAYAHGEDAWARACYVDDVLVGFVMLDLSEAPALWLWRLMIGQEHQRRGHGKAIVDAVVAYGKEHPTMTHLMTSYVPGEGTPGPFYEGYGFAPTGAVEEGEVLLRLDW